MYLLYEVLLHLVFIVAMPWLLVLGFLRGKYLPNFRQRLGRYRGAPSSHDLWIHAVSVGETLAARPVIEEILRLRPATTIVITTTTITGQQMAKQFFPDHTITYFPFDFSASVRRFIDHHSPRVYATMETEIWPNAARVSHARGLQLALANGRISDRSLPRYKVIRPFLSRVLSLYSRIMVREPVDAGRFIAIGAPPDRVQVCGTLKFDVAVAGRTLEFADELERLAAGRPIFVAGSTVEGEDELLLPSLQELIARGVFVVVAPRKPDRFEIVAGLLTTASVRFVRRTELGSAAAAPADLLLVDSIGELADLYRYAVAAFVGGSLANTGGHNPIEPLAVGVPVAYGPAMWNFREIASTFESAGASLVVQTPGELVDFVTSMIAEPDRRAEMGRRGRETVERNRGAAHRIASILLELLS